MAYRGIVMLMRGGRESENAKRERVKGGEAMGRGDESGKDKNKREQNKEGKKPTITVALLLTVSAIAFGIGFSKKGLGSTTRTEMLVKHAGRDHYGAFLGVRSYPYHL